MSLTIFELDNTLFSWDSDYSWGQFLVQKEKVDPVQYEVANAAFYEQHKQDTLDIHEYSVFSFHLTQFSMEELGTLHAEFMEHPACHGRQGQRPGAVF
jgi:FMN phosphatase YigB (HAD superfamily)